MTLHVDTPLVDSCPLSFSSGRSAWMKLDALHPSGSFKIRGIGFACETYRVRGARRLVSSSGGNAGLAVACEPGAELDRFETILIVVCGGATATIDQIRK